MIYEAIQDREPLQNLREKLWRRKSVLFGLSIWAVNHLQKKVGRIKNLAELLTIVEEVWKTIHRTYVKTEQEYYWEFQQIVWSLVGTIFYCEQMHVLKLGLADFS